MNHVLSEQIINKQTYSSNFARAASYFLGTCAPKPSEPCFIPAYEFITNLYAKIMQEPELFGFKPTADVFFGPWESQKERLMDVKSIRTAIEKVETIIYKLYEIVEASSLNGDSLDIPNDYKITQPLSKALKALGVEVSKTSLSFLPLVASGLKTLASVSKANTITVTDNNKGDKEYLFFSRCVFNPEENWTARCFDSMLSANGSFLHFCSEMENRGYKRIVCRDGKRVSLDYVKSYGSKEYPVKQSWGDKYHIGIEVTQEDLRLEPIFFWLRIVEFKTILENINSLPSMASSFILENTKHCNGCRYCVQTDKTGTRPLAAIECNEKMICPLFPSFSLNFRYFDSTLEAQVLATLDSIASYLNISY